MFNLYRLSRSIKLGEFLARITTHSLSVHICTCAPSWWRRCNTKVYIYIYIYIYIYTRVDRKIVMTIVHITAYLISHDPRRSFDSTRETKQHYRKRKSLPPLPHPCGVHSRAAEIFFPSPFPRFFLVARRETTKRMNNDKHSDGTETNTSSLQRKRAALGRFPRRDHRSARESVDRRSNSIPRVTRFIYNRAGTSITMSLCVVCDSGS